MPPILQLQDDYADDDHVSGSEKYSFEKMRNTVFSKREILFIIIVQCGERRGRRDAIHLLLIRSTLLWKCQGVLFKLGCPGLRPSVKVEKCGRTFLEIKRDHWLILNSDQSLIGWETNPNNGHI